MRRLIGLLVLDDDSRLGVEQVTSIKRLSCISYSACYFSSLPNFPSPSLFLHPPLLLLPFFVLFGIKSRLLFNFSCEIVYPAIYDIDLIQVMRLEVDLALGCSIFSRLSKSISHLTCNLESILSRQQLCC